MKGKLKEKRLRVLLYEGEGARPLGDDRRLATLTALLEDGHCVTRIADGGAVAAADDSEHLLVGDFEQEPASREGMRVVPMGESDPQALKETLRSEIAEAGGVSSGAWKPWFPVIDYDRCTNCMQCLTFCLFDVYGSDKQEQIQVQKEDNCKTDCPACSRVCPESGDPFPQVQEGSDQWRRCS